MHAEAIGILREIERRSDTSAFTYRGVCAWPLARLRLWTELMRRMVIDKKGEGDAIANTAPTFAADPKAQAETVGPQALGLLRAAGSAAEFVARPDALFFARPEEHGEKTPAGAYAKIIDSVIGHVRDPWSKIELADPRTIGFPRANPSLFLDLGRVTDVRFEPPGALAGFANLAAATAATAGIALDQASLTADMGKIFYFARIFEKLLTVLSPRALILSVYYHPVGMAWMLACRWAGITSVDLQHGRLGPLHGLYTDLTAAPADGYHLLPDRVWCWGARTKADIERDMNPACRRHRGFVGGNAWLYKWRYGDTAAFSPPGLEDFQARVAGKRKILVSLQPLDRPVPPALVSAMQNAPADWFWLLRTHPLRRHTAPEIAALLSQNGIANFEIECSTSFPLFALLRMADHHVTVFSSVVVEAANFDLRTSLLGPEGAAAFAPEVAQGIARPTLSGDALLAHVREVLSAEREPVRSDFVDMSEGAPDRALANLLRPDQALSA